MSLIDKTYFIKEIKLPNLNEDVVVAPLNEAIEKYEKELLIQAFGYELYKLFINNPETSIYKSIIDGEEFSFEFCGKTVTREWVGLQNDEKESMLAYYTYYKRMEYILSITSGVGEVLANTQNSDRISPMDKMVNAWSSMLTLYGDLQRMTGYNCVYPSYFDKFNLSTYCHYNDDPSLYNYLLANKSNYPQWEFTPKGRVNSFGI